MNLCSNSAVLLLISGLYFSPSLLLAQEKNSPSQKASDIQDTAPASLSEQDSNNSFSRQELCQISQRLSQPAQANAPTRSGSDSVLLESPNNGKIRQGFPLSKVLGSLAEKEGQNGAKPQVTSNDCEQNQRGS